MSEKINWVDLRRLVAQRAGVKEKEAGLFLNTLVLEVVAGLKTDKSVRINGLGTFRLQAVAPRKSVNVSTGEAITIDGYNKLNFNPEAGVKELIQSTHTPKTNTAVDDELTPLKKLGEQANEIVDILAELGQMPGAPVAEEEAPAPEPEPKVEEPKVEETPAPEPEPEPAAEPLPEETKQEEPQQEETKQKGTGVWRWIRDVIIAVIILLILLFGGIFLLREGLSGFFEKLAGNSPATEQEAEAEPSTPLVPQDTIIPTQSMDTVSTTTPAPTENAASSATSATPRTYTELITIEEMHQDSRLAWMAYRYYGNKDLWVFIYEANMDHIPNPNNINVGTPIRIPKLSKQMMDVTNPDTRKAILELQEKFGK